MKDYKFFCFDGEPKFLYVAFDRIVHKTKFDFYDLEWNRILLKQYYPNSKYEIDRPKELEKMILLAQKLSSDFPHVRVDFYINNGKVLIGEMTFFHLSGNKPFEPYEYDEKFGDLLDLPEKSVLN